MTLEYSSSKPMVASKGVWAGAATFVGSIVSAVLIKHNLPADLIPAGVIETVLATGAAGLFSIFSRVTAKKPIEGVVSKQP